MYSSLSNTASVGNANVSNTAISNANAGDPTVISINSKRHPPVYQ